MTTIIKLPDVGEGVAEAEIVEVLVRVGDEVTEDQVIAAVMTDKATVEIPAPVAGRIVSLGMEVGAVLAVGSEIARIEADASVAHKVAADDAAPAPPLARSAPPSGAGENPSPASPPPVPAKTVAAEAVPPLAPPRLAGAKPLASPSVRRRARELAIDLARVQGSGPAGRIDHADLDAFVAGGAKAGPSAVRGPRTDVETVRIVGLRKRIAERMAEATRRVAHFSYIEEVDVTELERLRARLNARHAETRGKLTVLPFLVAALVRARDEFPQMNALYDDEAQVVTRHGAVHAGIATQTPNGLTVPVLRHAETLDPWQCGAEIRRLAGAARDGSAKRDELTGSTITITSLGELGGIATTPVINRPEVAIVGVNRIAIRPVWQDGIFVPRQMMNLSSSFDHRVIDGYDAARFVQRLKELLETPALLFVEV
jgi:2-oxoisovalerate dehydrogenase E2 component (dihydrolipoyl transacylase)